MRIVTQQETTEAKPLLKWVGTAESPQEAALLAAQERDRVFRSMAVKKAGERVDSLIKTGTRIGVCMEAGCIFLAMTPWKYAADSVPLLLITLVVMLVFLIRIDKQGNIYDELEANARQEQSTGSSTPPS